jgi:hypothetical protein
MKVRSVVLCLASLAVWCLAPSTHAGSYFQDFQGLAVGVTNMGDGSQLFSTAPSNTAGVVDGTFKELRLTADGSNGTHSAFLLPALDTGATVYAFSAKWNSPVFGNFNNAADGFSFTFGPLAGLNLASNVYAQESGFGTGLTFSVRTYAAGSPGFFVNVNGSQVAAVTNNPQTVWGVYNATRHFFEVDWHVHLGMTVRLNGQTIFSNVATTGFLPHPTNRFAWAARTGGLNQEFRLDNIVVVSRGLLYEYTPASPYHSDSTNGSESQAFDRNSSTWWSKSQVTGIIGATLSPPRNVRVYALQSSGNGNRTQDPRTWNFQGSNNGGGSWSNCGSGIAYFINNNETRAFLATNAPQFGAHRLNITGNNSNLFATTLGELRTFEFLSITNDAPFRDWYVYGLADFSYSDMAWADYDSDGDLDFIVAGRVDGGSGVTELWKNQGDGSFQKDTASSIVNIENAAVAWGDYNNDGWVDLFLSGGLFSDTLRLYKNDGDGTFTEVATSMGAFGDGEARWFDYDNDGDLDLIYAGQVSAGLWRNNGDDTFTVDTNVSVPVAYDSTIEICDYDLDGYLDYATAGSGQPKLMRNNGDGTFGSTLINFVNMNATPFSWGDADADGDPDLFFTGHANNSFSISEWRINNASDLTSGGSLSNHVVVRGGDAAWGDYDHDGYPDVLLAGIDSGVNQARLIRNNGNGTLNGLTNVQMGGFNDGTYGWGDFDNDGRLDFLVCGHSNFSPSAKGVAEVHRNFFAPPNAAPSAPIALTQTVNGFVATFAWGAASDDVTPSNALTYALRIGTTPGGCEIMSPHASSNGFRLIPENGNCWNRRSKPIQMPGPGTYYWSVQAIDSAFAGGPFGTEQSVVITASPPVVAAREPLAVSETQATIRCSATTLGVTGTVWFLWGTNENYGSTVAGPVLRTGTNFVLCSATLTGLIPGLTYYYRPVVSNVAGTITNDGMAFVARTAGMRFDFTDSGDPLFASPENFPESESPTQGIDNALSTKYLNFDGPGSGLAIRPSVTGMLRAITIASANDSSERDPTSFTLAGSADGTNFVQFESGAVPAFTDRHEIQSVTLTNPASHAWYRLLFPELNEEFEMQVAEVELLPYGDIVAPTDAPDLSLAPPGLNVVFSHDRLFDRFVNDNEDKFEATGFSTSDLVRIELALTNGATILKGFELVGGTGYISNPERRPGSVAVSGSNDGTNYTVLAVVVPAEATYDYPILEYSTTNNAYAFTTYRVTFDAPTNGAHVELGEVRLFGRSATAIEQWRQQHFGSTDDSGSADDVADADGDLHENLFEYATGSDPTSSNSVSGIDLVRTNQFRFLFDRNTAATDATIYVEGSDSLTSGATWQGIATNRNGSWGGATNVTEGGGNPAAVSVTDPQPGTNRFLRLRVTHP